MDCTTTTSHPPYSEAQSRAWLSWLARGMQAHGQTVFMLEQLQPSWLPTAWQRLFYVITSRILIGIFYGLTFAAVSVCVPMVPRHNELDQVPMIPLIGESVICGFVFGLMTACLDLRRFGRTPTGTDRPKASTWWRHVGSVFILGLILISSLGSLAFVISQHDSRIDQEIERKMKERELSVLDEHDFRFRMFRRHDRMFRRHDHFFTLLEDYREVASIVGLMGAPLMESPLLTASASCATRQLRWERNIAMNREAFWKDIHIMSPNRLDSAQTGASIVGLMGMPLLESPLLTASASCVIGQWGDEEWVLDVAIQREEFRQDIIAEAQAFERRKAFQREIDAIDRKRIPVWIKSDQAIRSAFVFALVCSFVFGMRRRMPQNDIQTVETLNWSWERGRRGILIGTPASVAGGLVWLWYQAGSAASSVDQQHAAVALLFGVFFGLIPGLFLSTVGALRQGVEEMKTVPNKGITLTMRCSAFMGVVFGLSIVVVLVAAAAVVALVPVLDAGLDISVTLTQALLATLSIGLVSVLVAGSWFGALDVLNHYVLRLTLYLFGHTPWNYVRFLDYAAKDLNFLQKVGGGYIFIHRILLEHFATMKYGIPRNSHEPPQFATQPAKL